MNEGQAETIVECLESIAHSLEVIKDRVPTLSEYFLANSFFAILVNSGGGMSEESSPNRALELANGLEALLNNLCSKK